MVKNEWLQNLGLDRSLFERYHEDAHMLDTQYRMVSPPRSAPSPPAAPGRPQPQVAAPAPLTSSHPCLQHEGICAFPSVAFYKSRLKTWQGLKRLPSVLGHAGKESCPVIFGHVQGHERSLLVSTDEGNENSKANLEEVAEVVSVWCLEVREGLLEEGRRGTRVRSTCPLGPSGPYHQAADPGEDHRAPGRRRPHALQRAGL